MDQLSAIQSKLAPELARMNAVIHDFLSTPNQLMNHVVTNYLALKGKQIRPILVLLSASFFGKVNEDVIHAGAALEMLHNASLIHDDVVDETTMRRGRPTINLEWGNHLAVLVGDFFVSNALAAGIATGNIEIIASLSALGKELSLGEVDQICNARDHSFDEGRYMEMIRKKTASLFMNCVKMGAEAVGVDSARYSALMDYALLLGLCFQIRDDIFDYYNNPLIGKPTGNDLREGKITLPLLYALNNTHGEKTEEMKRLLERGDLSDGDICILIEFAVENKGVDYAYSRMREMQREAVKILDSYPDSPWKDSFLDLFEYIISRDK